MRCRQRVLVGRSTHPGYGQSTTERPGYWNDEVQGEARDYKDLDETPAGVAGTTKTVAANAAHLARLLKADGYPPS